MPAGAVEKSRNRRPSSQALRINTGDHLEKKLEKMPPQSHITKKPVAQARRAFLLYGSMRRKEDHSMRFDNFFLQKKVATRTTKKIKTDA